MSKTVIIDMKQPEIAVALYREIVGDNPELQDVPQEEVTSWLTMGTYGDYTISFRFDNVDESNQ